MESRNHDRHSPALREVRCVGGDIPAPHPVRAWAWSELGCAKRRCGRVPAPSPPRHRGRSGTSVTYPREKPRGRPRGFTHLRTGSKPQGRMKGCTNLRSQRFGHGADRAQRRRHDGGISAPVRWRLRCIPATCLDVRRPAVAVGTGGWERADAIEICGRAEACSMFARRAHGRRRGTPSRQARRSRRERSDRVATSVELRAPLEVLGVVEDERLDSLGGRRAEFEDLADEDGVIATVV
jgi:hypothetical protein